jgi:hypothetical protein
MAGLRLMDGKAWTLLTERKQAFGASEDVGIRDVRPCEEVRAA